jgi:four helix bundle protein
MSDLTPTTRFAHQRLDAYHVAMELFREVEQLAAVLPRGHADLKDQLRRACAATVRHIAEGANRYESRDKAARFVLARAECGECEAALEMVESVIPAMAGRARRLRFLADRVAAMLFGLVRRERARLQAPP